MHYITVKCKICTTMATTQYTTIYNPPHDVQGLRRGHMTSPNPSTSSLHLLHGYHYNNRLIPNTLISRNVEYMRMIDTCDTHYY